MIIDVNVGYNLIEKVTVSCDSPDIAIDMTLGVTAHDQLTEASRSLPNQHPIAAITNLGTTLSGLSGDISIVQSDLAAHKNATNPHNITPAGIGALSKVEHDSSLSGNGTNESPLVVDNVVLDYTTTNVITSLTLTQDKNGNPLNLVNFDIIISGENVDTLNNCNMILNNNNTAIYYNGVTLSTNSVIYLYLRGQQDKRFQGQVMFRKINNTYYFFQITNDTTVSGASRSNIYGGRVITDIGNVTRIYFTTINWKVGTNIKIMRV